MRDVWVAFLQEAAPDSKIVQLQDQMKNSHALMYESISDTSDLKKNLAARLEAWASIVGPKFLGI
jgi:hypothetical protein